MRRVSLTLLWVLAVLLAACASKRPHEASYAEESGSYDFEYRNEASPKRARADYAGAPPPPAPSMARAAAPAAMAYDELEAAPEAPVEASAPTDPAAPPRVAAERMVHYNGWARLRVARTEELVQEVADVAVAAGGEVESLDPRRVTVRVPVARFHEIFALVLRLGDVLDKSVSAEDITEAYSAVDLRLQTARATRERLMAILSKTKDEKQKIQILKQIQRLTEEIDGLESRLRVLSTLAAYSRITVEGVPRQGVEERRQEDEIAGFEWIRALSPFRRDVAYSGKALRLDVPEGFVLLDEKRRFVAESADGAVIWASRLDNAPEGDAPYWIEAVRSRLAPEFSSATVTALGPWQVLRLVDPAGALPAPPPVPAPTSEGSPWAGAPATPALAPPAPVPLVSEPASGPYVYIVAIQVVGDERWMVEVYFPSPAQETRYGPAVRAAIEGRNG